MYEGIHDDALSLLEIFINTNSYRFDESVLRTNNDYLICCLSGQLNSIFEYKNKQIKDLRCMIDAQNKIMSKNYDEG